MKMKFLGGVLVPFSLAAALWFGTGCAHPAGSAQTLHAPAAMHVVKRLWVVVNVGVLVSPMTAAQASAQLKLEALAANLRGCLSNTPAQVQIVFVNDSVFKPQAYQAPARDFYADAILTLQLRDCDIDPLGNYPFLYLDAALFNEINNQLVWRKPIAIAGDPGAIEKRTLRLAQALAAQLRADGLIESPSLTAAENAGANISSAGNLPAPR